jgi:CubicO group peptidase (beta-lactamase class C family)
VSRDSRVVFERAYGWARLYDYGDGQYSGGETDEPPPRVPGRLQDQPALRRLQNPPAMTTETVFDLASVTKVMATTFAVMLLVEAGELELDDPVVAYLPDFGDALITVRHLLTHRSGLSQWQPVYYHAANADEAYAYIRDLPLEWGVGAERHYSDLGFMLLGYVVESVAGMPLDAFLAQRLYRPLELSATGFRRERSDGTSGPADSIRPAGPFAATSHGNPYEHRMVHDPDFGYRIEGDPDAWNDWRRYTVVGEVNDGNAFHAFDGVAGHAGLFSTAADLQVLVQLLLNRGEYGGRRYIGADVVDAFLAPTGDGQALGWQVPEGAPPGSFTHTGFTGTYVLGNPAVGLALILLTNRQNVGVDERNRYPDVSELQRQVATALMQ